MRACSQTARHVCVNSMMSFVARAAGFDGMDRGTRLLIASAWLEWTVVVVAQRRERRRVRFVEQRGSKALMRPVWDRWRSTVRRIRSVADVDHDGALSDPRFEF